MRICLGSVMQMIYLSDRSLQFSCLQFITVAYSYAR